MNPSFFADPRALARQRAAIVHGAAMRADAPVRPNAGLNPLVGRCFVAEVLGVENATHALKIAAQTGYVKYNNARKEGAARAD